MSKAHKFNRRPWWDEARYMPMHRADGTRYEFRINYERMPILPEFMAHRDVYSYDPEKRLKARKRLWRRLRTGYYDRHDFEPCPFTIYGRSDDAEPERCGARCRDGHPCKNKPVENPVTGKQDRCRLHGGASTGPKSEEGKRRSLEALARGRATRSRGAA